MKIPILSLSRRELLAITALKKYQSSQLISHIYKHGYTNFYTEFSNLSKPVRESLDSSYTLQYPTLLQESISEDKTRKWLLQLDKPENKIETVWIPDHDYTNFPKGTLCISSQIGCSLSCSFCKTGTQKLIRNLTPDEIVGQVLFATSRLNGFPIPISNERVVDNIVFMGQGEPLYNYKNVFKSVEILIECYNYTPRKITLSTSGVAPLLTKIPNGIGLAISLHAATDELRNELVPLNKTYNIDELMNQVKDFIKITKQRVTFEYVLIKGVNDKKQDARALLKLISPFKFKCLVNLMPFNEWDGSPFIRSEKQDVDIFAHILRSGGLEVSVRRSMGSDIGAACGLLKSLDINKARSLSVGENIPFKKQESLRISQY